MLSRIYLTGVVFIGCILLPAAGYAAPSISSVAGDFAHGNEVTISGVGFGAKLPAKPYLWAPFDGSANPSQLGVVTSWAQVQSMAYVAGEGVAGSGAFKATNGSGTWTARVDGFGWTNWGQRSYLFRKTKRNFNVANNYEVNYSFDQGGVINWKVIRLWPSSELYPNFTFNTGNGNIVTETYRSDWMQNVNVARGPTNQWKTEELILQANSSASATDGIARFFVDGAAGFSFTNWSFRNSTTNGSSVMSQYYPVHGVNANVTFPSHYRYWADDVYLDTTWARVMIGNAQTLSASTIREIQIPIEWTSDTIKVSVNSRAFPSGTTAYLFVVDANGNVSDGISLSTLPPPRPPGDISVQ